MEYTFKTSSINNLKVLFLCHRLNLLEQKIKNGGHLTNFLSGEHILPLPPHILSIIQYKALWSVLLKHLALTISKFCFYLKDFYISF